ncbi:AtzG-like protein [Sphingomonas sp. 4RDLI-65]|uniref:AtzG-like protein n=1 Tax=Sphingomonas sp. 4RDLI-65 TaxID=3111641 RepID=UPI003C16C009
MTIITALRHLLRQFHIQRVDTPATPDPCNRTALPRTRSEIVQAAALLDLTIPDACLPGVEANLALLDSHADILLHPARRGDQ